MRVMISEEGQNAISAARWFKKNGIEVILASPIADSTIRRIFRSRAIKRSIQIEIDNNEEKVKNLKDVYDSTNCDVYYPFGFRAVTEYMESANRDPSMIMNVPYGDYNTYWDLSDKDRLYTLLKELPIPLPKRYGIAKENKIPKIDDEEFPLIVKATRGKGIMGNLIMAKNRWEMVDYIKKNAKGREFILQKYIPGDVFDVGGFALNGRIHHNVPQRRTVTLPLRGGVAAVNDIYPNDRLLELTSKVIEKSGWSGPFQAEYRYEPSEGDFYLIEVNAKMWGSTQLTLRSNSKILRMALDFAMKRDVEEDTTFKKGLRHRWLSQEMMALRFGGLLDLRDFLKRFFQRSGYDFQLNDPFPDIHRYLITFGKVALHPGEIPKPLIDRKTHQLLNQNL